MNELLDEVDSEGLNGRFIDARLRRSVETDVMYTLAGGLVEDLVMGSDNKRGLGLVQIKDNDEWRAFLERHPANEAGDVLIGPGDFRAAWELVEKVSGSREEADAYLCWLTARTNNPDCRPGLHARRGRRRRPSC